LDKSNNIGRHLNPALSLRIQLPYCHGLSSLK
jgi:hypothetical protein